MKTTITFKKSYGSGRREGWGKVVKSVDESISTGYAFTGDFLKEGENRVSEGAVIIEMKPTGSAKTNGKSISIYRAENGELTRVSDREFDLRTEIESLKSAVALELGSKTNPLDGFSTSELELEIERRNQQRKLNEIKSI